MPLSAIAVREAERAARQVLLTHGLCQEHAEFVVDTLVYASLRGVDTHGLELLPTYIQELEGGRCKRQPDVRILRSAPAFALLDGDAGLGVVVANVAIRKAMDLARGNGVGAVAVANSNHFGPAGYYSDLAARSGMIGLSFSNSDVLVAAHNGAKAASGTNPIAIAAPGLGEELFSLDMATSQVAYSRVRRHLAEQRPLEAGWAVDNQGRDSAQTGEIAALVPLGGYKGQGLAMAVQVLTAVLTQMPLDHELSHLFAPPYDQPRKVAHLFLCIDIAAASEPKVFESRLSELTAHMRAESRDGCPPVLSPGDNEAASTARRLQEGVPASAVLRELLENFL